MKHITPLIIPALVSCALIAMNPPSGVKRMLFTSMMGMGRYVGIVTIGRSRGRKGEPIVHESVTSRYHADMRTKDILVHRYDTLIECFLAFRGYDKMPEEGFDNYYWEGYHGGRKYLVNVGRWLRNPKKKAWGWASYRQKAIHLWWDPDCAREELASVIAHEFAHLHRPRHKNKMEEEKKADLCGRAARFAMTFLMNEEITVSSDKELSVKNVLENLNRVLGPLSEDRPKCDFVHCAAGEGVAGAGKCFLPGDKDDPDCPNFMTEEDFKPKDPGDLKESK